MRLLLVLTIALGTMCSQAWTYSKYGRTCVDIGCVQNEVCVMKEDPCPRVARVRNCGPYPTCERVSSAPSTCATYVCPPTQECQLHNGAPRCVTKASSNSLHRHTRQTTYGLGHTGSHPTGYNQNLQHPSLPQGTFHPSNSTFQNPGHLYPGIGINQQHPGTGQTYPGQQHPTYPGQQPQTYPGQQHQTYPGQQHPTYSGQQPQIYPGQQPQTYPGQQPQTYPGQQPQTYPGQQHQTYPGQQHPTYPGQQPQTYPGQHPQTHPSNPGNDFYQSQTHGNTAGNTYPIQPGYQGGNYNRNG